MSALLNVRRAIDEGRPVEALDALHRVLPDPRASYYPYDGTSRDIPPWAVEKPEVYAPVLLAALQHDANAVPESVRCAVIRGLAPLMGQLASRPSLVASLRRLALGIASAEPITTLTPTALREAIENPVVVGPLHPALILSSLRANNPSVGLSFLRHHTALLLDDRMGAIEDYLLFYYYSAMVMVTYKLWDEAILNLRSVLVADMQSSISLAASKLLAALELMTSGKLTTPLSMSWRVSNPEVMTSWTGQTFSVFDKGPAHLMIPQMRKAYITLKLVRHSRVFQRISLKELSARCSLSESETAEGILEAVEGGFIRAVISRANVVEFSDVIVDAVPDIQEGLEEWMKLTRAVRDADAYVGRSSTSLSTTFAPTPECAAMIEEQKQEKVAAGGLAGVLRQLR